jgi:hypothetical protein
MVSSTKIGIEALRQYQLVHWIWRTTDFTRLPVSVLKEDCEIVGDIQLYTLPKITIRANE